MAKLVIASFIKAVTLHLTFSKRPTMPKTELNNSRYN
jgi:hypothetical protein